MGEFALQCDNCGADLREQTDELQSEDQQQEKDESASGDTDATGGTHFETITGTKARRQDTGPDEEEKERMLSGFNWGALMLTPFWGFAHNWIPGYIYLLDFVLVNLGGVVGLVGPQTLIEEYAGGATAAMIFALIMLAGKIYAGFKGNEIAWNSGRFDDLHQCVSVQEIWNQWGCGCCLVQLLYLIWVTFALVTALLAAGTLAL